MGYTHYWNTSLKGIPPKPWQAICADVRKLLASLPQHSKSAGQYYASEPLALALDFDTPAEPPEVSADKICFNGIGELGYETFYFERRPQQEKWREGDSKCFAFCKTDRKPYGLVVCGVLLVVTKHAGRYVEVTSDGWRDEWKPVFDWVQSVLGDGYALPAGLKVRPTTVLERVK